MKKKLMLPLPKHKPTFDVLDARPQKESPQRRNSLEGRLKPVDAPHGSLATEEGLPTPSKAKRVSFAGVPRRLSSTLYVDPGPTDENSSAELVHNVQSAGYDSPGDDDMFHTPAQPQTKTPTTEETFYTPPQRSKTPRSMARWLHSEASPVYPPPALAQLTQTSTEKTNTKKNKKDGIWGSRLTNSLARLTKPKIKETPEKLAEIAHIKEVEDAAEKERVEKQRRQLVVEVKKHREDIEGQHVVLAQKSKEKAEAVYAPSGGLEMSVPTTTTFRSRTPNLWSTTKAKPDKKAATAKPKKSALQNQNKKIEATYGAGFGGQQSAAEKKAAAIKRAQAYTRQLTSPKKSKP